MAGLGQPAREDDSKEILVEVDFDGNGFLYFGNGSITRKSYSIDLYFSRSFEDPFQSVQVFFCKIRVIKTKHCDLHKSVAAACEEIIR